MEITNQVISLIFTKLSEEFLHLRHKKSREAILADLPLPASCSMAIKATSHKVGQFFGTYQRNANQLKNEVLPGHLQIVQRKNGITATKPPLYILHKALGQCKYVSSMYPLRGLHDVYKIEYGGTLAKIDLSKPDQVTITPWQIGEAVHSSISPEQQTEIVSCDNTNHSGRPCR